MRDPEDRVTYELPLPLMRQRIAQASNVVERSARLANQAQRVRAHFHSADPNENDLAEISLAINEAHTQLQVEIAEWLVIGKT